MWSTDSSSDWLSGWRLELPESPAPPVAGAARILAAFGAGVTGLPAGDPGSIRLHSPAGPAARVCLLGASVDHPIPSTYCALRLAAAAAGAARTGRDTTLDRVSLVAELFAPLRLRGATRPEVLRCRDGWAVVRWREPGERELLEAMVGRSDSRSCEDVVAAGRLARLLIAPVRPPRRTTLGLSPWSGIPAGATTASRRPGWRPRIVDWSVLWAGPWATGRLRRSGSLVCRVEHPRRPDGLLGWPEGRRWWRTLNERKRLVSLDARRGCDRDRLAREIAGADILVTSMTPRALRGLGFDDAWRREHAPELLHVELVAFEEPWSDAPGLGEHAAAQAGLLWREGSSPAAPLPWADPLLGALALTVVQAWLASPAQPSGRVRLSLEAAASLAIGVTGTGERCHTN